MYQGTDNKCNFQTQLMPSQLATQLQNLVPFLEASPASQDYLVFRLRELARGGAMSGYR